MRTKLDRYEKAIDRLEYRPATRRELAKVERLLDKARKNRTVNIRLPEGTLLAIKQRSLREGIPYQTLISSVLHKFVTNQYLEAGDMRKSIR